MKNIIIMLNVGKKKLKILTEDVDETIEFIKNKCDDET